MQQYIPDADFEDIKEDQILDKKDTLLELVACHLALYHADDFTIDGERIPELYTQLKLEHVLTILKQVCPELTDNKDEENL